MKTWLARFLAGTLLGALVLLALAMGGLRLAIVYIGYLEPQIQTLLERELAPGITFTELAGTMNGFNPVLSIDNVSLTLADRSQPVFIDRLEMEFDFFASLEQRAPVVREVSGQIEKIELVKDEASNWWISDLHLALDTKSDTSFDLSEAMAWVPGYLNLKMNRMVVVDRQTSTRHLFTEVSAQLNRQQQQYFVRFDAVLPEQLGRSLLVKSVIGPEQSLVYINTSQLQLTPIAELLDLDTRGLREGVFDGELWINLAGLDVVAINGNLLLEDGVVQMAADKKPLQVSYHSRFSAVERGDGWRINSSFDRLRVNERDVARFRSQVEISGRPGNQVVAAWVDRVPLESLPVVAGQWLPAEINEQISGGRLDGVLRDVLLRIELDRPEHFMLGALAREVSSKAFAEYPGASGINAEILVGNGRLGARLSGDNVIVDFGEHFSAPWELDRLEVDAVGRQGSRGLVLALDRIRLQNADVDAIGRAWLEFEQGQRPLAFIRASFEDARAGSIRKYLPRKYLPQKIQQWLERGIKGGVASAGELQYHGRLSDMRELEKQRAVEFYVDFAVDDAEVLFAPDWLPAQNGRGRVQFHNIGVQFDIDSASYDRIENARVRGGIEDFRKPVLDLHIETDSPTGDAVQSWLATPVGQNFHETIRNIDSFGGRVATAIDISLPLQGEDRRPQTLVKVDFADASAVADVWALRLSQVNGRLEADGEALRAQQIDALFFDDPIRIDVDGSLADGPTRVTARGRIESANLLRKLPPVLSEKISGRSDWRIDMDFSPRSRQPNQPLMHLVASSRMRESVIALPLPLDKPAGQELAVNTTVDFYPRQIRFVTRAGTLLQGRGRLEGDDAAGYRLSELDLALASGLVEEPGPGINIYGYIEEASLDEWMKVFNRQQIDEDLPLHSARLQIEHLQAFDREIASLQFDLQRVDGRFVGTLESPLISGSFELPRHPSSADPAMIVLDYLQIDDVETENRQSALKPGQLIDFHLSSKVLLYHDMLFRDLEVQARKGEDSLFVDKLSLLRDQLALVGRGQWNYDAVNDSHSSALTMIIRGPDVGKAIDGIGFGDTIDGGTLDFEGAFNWPAPIISFDLERLAGNARLTITDGVLNNVEPGSGRFVGLLSLSALPRRLSLDFSDVLIKGMEFEKISGTYQIEKGILYTRDTRMDGPAASIKIRGETNISTRSYDQNIRVTPKIRQTLPVIGAVSAGATVGWGLLLLQNLFKKAIDDAVEVEYQVTGSWDDPQIKLIKAVDEHHQNLPKRDEIPSLDN